MSHNESDLTGHGAGHVAWQRLRRRFETIQLKDSIPEVVFLNSHDGTSGYQLRMGIFRVVCTNGLIVSRGAFPGYCVSHRGNVVDEVIARALDISERFEGLALQVDRMEQRTLEPTEQVRFAERALTLRYPELAESGMQPSQLLTCLGESASPHESGRPHEARPRCAQRRSRVFGERQDLCETLGCHAEIAGSDDHTQVRCCRDQRSP